MNDCDCPAGSVSGWSGGQRLGEETQAPYREKYCTVEYMYFLESAK